MKVHMQWIIELILFLFAFTLQGYADNWQNVGPGAGSDLHFLAVQPDNADIIYAGGDIEGLFKTTDGGVTWQCINNNLAHEQYSAGVYWINDIVIDPVNYQHIYSCTGEGLFRSLNGGQSWDLLYPSEIVTEDDPREVCTLAVNPSDADNLLLGLGDGADGSEADFNPFPPFDGETGLFQSTDGGAFWNPSGTGISDGAVIHCIVFNPQNVDQVIAATTKGVYRSDNGGTSWSPKTTGLPHTNCHRMEGYLYPDNQFALILSMKVLGAPGNASSFSGGLFRSTDFGDAWVDITSNLPKYDPYDHLFYDYWKFDAHPTDPDIIYTGTVRGSGYEEPGLYATFNGGASWDWMHMQHEGGWLDTLWFWDPYFYDIKVCPSEPDRLVACLDWVETSDDRGTTWTQRYTTSSNGTWQGNGLELMNTDAIGFDPSDPDRFYVGYDDMGLFRSDDGGISYFRLDPAQDPTIGSLTEVDGVKDIVVDPVNGDLYISRWQGSQGGHDEGYTAGGIVFSDDLGNNVSDISNGLPKGRCDLVMDLQIGTPGNRTLYCAVFNHGVYKTTNSGGVWTAINGNLGGEASKVWEIAIDPTDSQTLYLGLNAWGEGGQNLYKSNTGGQIWNVVGTFPEGDVLAITVDKEGTVYASQTDNFDWNYTGGLYRSINGGDSWTQINDHSRVIDIQIHPTDANVLLSTGQQWYKPMEAGARLDLSTDGGDTWEDISGGMGHTFFNFARFDPHNPDRIFVGTAGGGLWMIDNAMTQVDQNHAALDDFILYPNYPNPFNPSTTIQYDLKESSFVTVKILNINGEEVITLMEGEQTSGVKTLAWNGTNQSGHSVGSGIYFCHLRTKSDLQCRKMLLTR
ncbi:T9SS type A sorting domain-containing protein [candidate division KSB1 bacterium]|nr:T9SS type A sorting domain-containing protein [candidate division KSB1 bacterium]